MIKIICSHLKKDLETNKTRTLKIKYMWKEENNQLQRSFEFNNFVEAFAFMTKVAFAAEKMGHHPNWTNVYNKVNIQLSTHNANNTITEKDIQLAKEIDAIFNKG